MDNQLALNRIWQLSNIEEKINLSLAVKSLSYYRYQNNIYKPVKFIYDNSNCIIDNKYMLYFSLITIYDTKIKYYNNGKKELIINYNIIYEVDIDKRVIRDCRGIIVGVLIDHAS